jgi:hypothetical protein
VLLPSTVRSIDAYSFGRCPSLAIIAIPKDCQVTSNAFYRCKPHVTMF